MVTLNGKLGSSVRCQYVTSNHFQVHAKVYCWYKENEPKIAFVGSSNYTRTGFFWFTG